MYIGSSCGACDIIYFAYQFFHNPFKSSTDKYITVDNITYVYRFLSIKGGVGKTLFALSLAVTRKPEGNLLYIDASENQMAWYYLDKEKEFDEYFALAKNYYKKDSTFYILRLYKDFSNEQIDFKKYIDGTKWKYVIVDTRSSIHPSQPLFEITGRLGTVNIFIADLPSLSDTLNYIKLWNEYKQRFTHRLLVINFVRSVTMEYVEKIGRNMVKGILYPPEELEFVEFDDDILSQEPKETIKLPSNLPFLPEEEEETKNKKGEEHESIKKRLIFTKCLYKIK